MSVERADPVDPTTSISSVTLYPAYGLLNNQVLEEYREHTVIGGLSDTGQLIHVVGDYDPKLSCHRWFLEHPGAHLRILVWALLDRHRLW